MAYFYQYSKKKQKCGLYDIQVGINLQEIQKYVPKGIQNKTFTLLKGPWDQIPSYKFRFGKCMNENLKDFSGVLVFQDFF